MLLHLELRDVHVTSYFVDLTSVLQAHQFLLRLGPELVGLSQVREVVEEVAVDSYEPHLCEPLVFVELAVVTFELELLPLHVSSRFLNFPVESFVVQLRAALH